MSSPCRLVQYQPAPNQPLWKIERFDGLVSDFDVKEADLPQFHGIASRFARPWEILRRIFGVNPVIVPLDTDAKYLGIENKIDVAVDLGLDEGELNAELELVGAAWKKVLKNQKPLEKPAESKTERKKTETVVTPNEAPAPQNTASVRVDLPSMGNSEREKLLFQYGFSNATFGQIDREMNEAVAERDWFASRVEELRKLFDEPMVSSLARQALLNEMMLRRVDAKLCVTEVDSTLFAELQETKTRIEKQYQEQWAQIEELFPQAKHVGNKVSFAAVLSDLVQATRDHLAKGENQRIDGLFTGYEIQIQVREAVQHDIRYRPGQVAAINEAIGGLWDPNWTRKLTDFQCKQLDEGFKEGARRIRENAGIPLPDLEDDGPRGEYPPLFTPKVEPEEPVSNIELKT